MYTTYSKISVTHCSYQGLYGSWIYNSLCSQCLTPLKLWVYSPSWQGVLDKTLCDKLCQILTAGHWFSPSTPVSSSNKTDCQYYTTEILLKVALNTIIQTPLFLSQSLLLLEWHLILSMATSSVPFWGPRPNLCFFPLCHN